VNPDIMMTILKLKMDLVGVKATTFGNNITDMLDHIEEIYADIIREEGSHEDYLINIFEALKTLNNPEWISFVRPLKLS